MARLSRFCTKSGSQQGDDPVNDHRTKKPRFIEDQLMDDTRRSVPPVKVQIWSHQSDFTSCCEEYGKYGSDSRRKKYLAIRRRR